MPHRTVGLDLSLTQTGMCLLKECALVETELVRPGKLRGTERLVYIEEVIEAKLNEWLPIDLICLEGYSYASAYQSHQIGELGGIIRKMLYENKFLCVEVAPQAVKKFATGKGNSKKDEVMLQVYKRWGQEFNNDNLADAFVLAMIGYHLSSGDRYGYTTKQAEVLEKLRKE